MSFELLSDLRDQIKECLEDLSCEYNFFVSLGIPPADCNSIAFWYDNSRRNRVDNGECTTSALDTEITITITRCCVTADAEVSFDFLQEEKDAKCFLDDLDALLACLSCNGSTLLEDYILSCGALITNVRLDNEKMGGCYSANITISFTEDICCE